MIRLPVSAALAAALSLVPALQTETASAQAVLAAAPAGLTAPTSSAPKATRRAISPEELAALLPAEGITADTDLRPYLLEGVPEELRLAVMRRTWALRSKIRDFRGLEMD